MARRGRAGLSAATRLAVGGGVDLLASEQALLGSPGKEDHDLPGKPLAGGRTAAPRRLVRAGHVSLLADALRADHDVGQVEVDVGKRGQQLHVEAGRTLVAFPAVAALYELVHAIHRQRRDQARQVALVFGDRMALPELTDLVELLSGSLATDQAPNVVGHRPTGRL